MNIIYLKQAVKTKVNTTETCKAIKKIIKNVLGDGNVEFVTIKTADIEGVGAGCNILVATTDKSNKIMISTLGASNQDFTCVTDDNKTISEVVRSFEYTMFMNKKVANISNFINIVEESKNNKDLYEALLTIGRIATNARYTNLISGSYGEVLDENTKSRYSGVVITDLMDNNNTYDIELDVLGRKGKLHLFQVIPLLKDEIEIIKEFEDAAIADVIATSFIYNDKDVFTNRRKLFNFSDVINAHTVDRDKLEEAGIKFEKDKPVINTLEHVNKVLELKSK